MSATEYRNGNILVPDGGINVIDVSSHPSVSLRCPHCKHIGSFPFLGKPVSFSKNFTISSGQNGSGGIEVTIRSCPNIACRGIVLVTRGLNNEIVCMPSETIDFNTSALPSSLLDTLSEAVRCHSAAAYRAAAIMVRRLLEEICEANGATGSSLHNRLQALKSKVTLPNELFEAMMELKILGNDAAHVAARDYLSIGKDESEDSIELAKEILKALYQLQALVDRLKSRKVQGIP